MGASSTNLFGIALTMISVTDLENIKDGTYKSPGTRH